MCICHGMQTGSKKDDLAWCRCMVSKIVPELRQTVWHYVVPRTDIICNLRQMVWCYGVWHFLTSFLCRMDRSINVWRESVRRPNFLTVRKVMLSIFLIRTGRNLLNRKLESYKLKLELKIRILEFYFSF